MSNQSLFFSVNSKRLPETEAAKAKEAFEKISNFSMEALSGINPCIHFDLSMTDLSPATVSQEDPKVQEKQNSYKQGVNDTHFFYLRGLLLFFLFLGAMTLAEKLHDSLPDATKAELASLVEGGKVFLAATMEKGHAVLGVIGEAALISFAAVRAKALEAFDSARNEL
jgi:hypothetical protein